MVDFDDSDYAEVMAASHVDVNEYANSYEFVIDTPGLKLGDVRVEVKAANNVLYISSERRRVEKEGAKCLLMERRMGKFMRKFALPESVNTDKITAVSRDGVLTLTVEKLPPQPKTIEVKYEALESCGDKRQRKVGAVDRISMLPDELLVRVLCLLSFKEATATSVLSRGWRYLHTFTTKLDFDGISLLSKSKKKKCEYDEMEMKETTSSSSSILSRAWRYLHTNLLSNSKTKKCSASDQYIDDFEEKRRKFFRWVDGVVELNQSSNLEEFRVKFHLSRYHSQHIDKWVRFALSRRVESLELLLIAYEGGDYDSIRADDYYVLNLHQYNKNQFYSLRKFSTFGVMVSGEGVEMLLRNCPLLEQVSVTASAHLFSLDIQKPFPAFKRLDISWCWKLSSVVVRDSNILGWTLVNVPYLTELWVGGWCTQRAENVMQMFSSVLPQLHMFKIRMESDYYYLNEDLIVEMSNLKQLVVDIGHGGEPDYEDSLLRLMPLIKASPRLIKFVIEEPYDKDCFNSSMEGDISISMVDRKIPREYR